MTLQRECKQQLESFSMCEKTTEIPPLLYDVHDVSQQVCSETAPQFVSVTATNVDAEIMNIYRCDIDSPHTISSSSYGWKQYTDRHVPGFIIDFCSGTPIDTRKLVFPLNIDVPRKIIFKVEYLRSYENAGVFQIYICGIKITKIDTLLNRKIAHFSMPDFYTYILPDNIFETCKSMSQNDRSFEMEYVPSPKDEHSRLLQKVKIMNIQVCG